MCLPPSQGPSASGVARAHVPRPARERLGGTGALLVLDNLEHLATAAAEVATLLSRIGDLDILTTSRAPLRLSGEYIVPLATLPVEDASTLFLELAAAHGFPLDDASRPAVEGICRRLDGLPLAIELVAARLVLLSPAELLAALDDGLALEMEGPVDLPARQRTLHATLDWSYGLLTGPQQSCTDRSPSLRAARRSRTSGP